MLRWRAQWSVLCRVYELEHPTTVIERKSGRGSTMLGTRDRGWDLQHNPSYNEYIWYNHVSLCQWAFVSKQVMRLLCVPSYSTLHKCIVFRKRRWYRDTMKIDYKWCTSSYTKGPTLSFGGVESDYPIEGAGPRSPSVLDESNDPRDLHQSSFSEGDGRHC